MTRHTRLDALPLTATVLIAALISILALTQGNDAGVPGSDKVHHALAFAALTFPLSIRSPRLAAWMVLIAIGYGGMIEAIQPYVGRDGESLDLLADTCGALAGAATGLTLSMLWRGRRRVPER